MILTYLVKCPNLLVFLTNLPKSNSKRSLFGPRTNFEISQRAPERTEGTLERQQKLCSRSTVAYNRQQHSVTEVSR